MPHVRAQGIGETCVAFATGYMKSYLRSRELDSNFVASPRFIYCEARKAEKHPDKDRNKGIEIREGLRVLKNLGVPSETECPYNDSNLTPCESPEVMIDAGKNKIATYARLSKLYEIKQILARRVPVVIGVPVFENWKYSEVTGVIPMPVGGIEGNHAVCVCGYDDVKGWFIFENSWGEIWAPQSLYKPGFGIIRYDYLQEFLENGDADVWASADFTKGTKTGNK